MFPQASSRAIAEYTYYSGMKTVSRNAWDASCVPLLVPQTAFTLRPLKILMQRAFLRASATPKSTTLITRAAFFAGTVSKLVLRTLSRMVTVSSSHLTTSTHSSSVKNSCSSPGLHVHLCHLEVFGMRRYCLFSGSCLRLADRRFGFLDLIVAPNL